MKTYVLFHGNCFDGFGAAYAAWKKFKSGAVYIPCVYGAPMPEIDAGSRVYMIDFSLPRDQMIALNELCGEGNLTVIDHHKTAEENLKGLPFAHFDMTKSGALLAWKYFFPYTRVPELIEYISDHDLWEHKLEFSREVHAGLASYPYDFEIWDELEVDALKFEGSSLLRYQEVLVNMICKQAVETIIGGHKVMCVNSTSHWSEVGNRLAAKYSEYAFGACYYYAADGTIKYSLRSVGEFDVSAVAKLYGGGGHKNAAGFVLKPGETL